MTTTAPTQAPSDLDPRLLVDEQGVRGYYTAFKRRVTGGELGSLPVVIGLVVIWAIFYMQESRFLSAQYLTNLSLQMCATGLISVGIVMVLLLGEVDLSVGSVSGLTAAIMATQIFRHHTNQYLAILMALAVGALIGAFHGAVFAKFGVPSFVVTLAGLIAWQGFQLRVLGADGTVTIPSGPVQSLTSAFYSDATGWALAVVGIVIYAAAQLWEVRTRTRAGLRPRPMVEVGFRVAVVAAALAVAVAVLNRYRGVPFALVLFLVVVVVFDLIIRRTRYGRHVLAVGGNIEAARRAGIGVSFIRISVFSIAGLMAAAGGLVAASRISSVSQSSGGSDTLLNAIAAAVIGGTSLFGGRGSAYSALLGILVIQSIANGMALLGLQSSTQFIITGAVLLAAVTIDALGRHGRAASGRG
jgi:D-xylose transport system permease protein